MEFPHLKDTQFPYLDRENVYEFRNEFDYTRWNPRTIVHLLNVRWDSSYRDVPIFASDNERDRWFERHAETEIELVQAARILPDGYIKLPLPYDVATMYNYLYIEAPIATSEDSPIDYEIVNGLRKWFFFIDSIEYGSPNCTHTYLTLDVWTTFQSKINIQYMMLERGHAPVAATDTDTYLSNPVENCEHLLTSDVDFGGRSIVRSSSFVPFGNGTKYVVFASMATRADMLVMGQRTGSGSGAWTAAKFSSSSARDGHDMNISGYVWGNGYDYSTLRTRVTNGASNLDRVANNITCWAIPATDCFGFRGYDYDKSFLVRMGRECPSFMQTIKAMFVVDESMLSFNYEPVTICDYKLRYCRGVEEEPISIALNRDMFSIPERYQRFAKLYTFPYSALELTDNDGKTIDVHIEDTGQLSFQRITSLAFPYLDMRVLFHGIAGSGSTSYKWISLTGTEETINIGSDDWGNILFDWPIPTYALYMDGETSYYLHRDGDLKNARIDAVSAYHASMRQANCAKNNAIALADAAQSNANAIADTIVANNANTCNSQTANTALTVATNTANVALANETSLELMRNANNTSWEIISEENSLMYDSTSADNEVTVATTANNADLSVRSGAISGVGHAVASAGFMAEGGASGAATMGATMAIGGLMGALGGMMEANVATANAMVITQAKSQLASKTADRNRNVTDHKNDENRDSTNATNDLHTDQTDNTNDCLTAQTANNVAAATANAGNSAATTRGNAARSSGTARSNAGYTQTAAERSAKEYLEAAQRKARNRMECAQNDTPVSFGETSGSVAPDYHRTRGVQVKVRTQSDSAIARTGDYFARYGYAYDGVWDMRGGLCPMEHFCYWKVRDIWLECEGATGNHNDKILTDMFRAGVTVWKNPDEIGRVSIYDN